VKDTLITAMNAQNPNKEINSLKITQNPDGSYAMIWDKQDPTWAFLNSLTSAEIQIIMEQAIQSDRNGL
jgi:hypothetical protein